MRELWPPRPRRGESSTGRWPWPPLPCLTAPGVSASALEEILAGGCSRPRARGPWGSAFYKSPEKYFRLEGVPNHGKHTHMHPTKLILQIISKQHSFCFNKIILKRDVRAVTCQMGPARRPAGDSGWGLKGLRRVQGPAKSCLSSLRGIPTGPHNGPPTWGPEDPTVSVPIVSRK